MDEVPLRRSLRVSGMTPLRPKSYVYDYRTGRSRSRSRSSSQTPKKANRPNINLPSDLSTSDFLGDTPTARFHRSQLQQPLPLTQLAYPNTIETIDARNPRDLATVVARRIANPDVIPVPPPTVRARKVQRANTSNVFVVSNEHGFLTLTIFSLAKMLRTLISFLFPPVPIAWNHLRKSYLINPDQKLIRSLALSLIVAILVGAVGVGIYSVERKVSMSIQNSTIPASNGKAGIHPAAVLKFDSVDESLKNIKARVSDIEISHQEIRSLFTYLEDSFKNDLDSNRSFTSALAAKEEDLALRISSFNSEMQVIKQSLKLHTEEMSTKLENRLLALQNRLDKFSRELAEVSSSAKTQDSALDYSIIESVIFQKLSQLKPQDFSNAPVSLTPEMLVSIKEYLAREPAVDSAASKFPAADFEKLELELDRKISRVLESMPSERQLSNVFGEQLAQGLRSFAEVEQIKWTSSLDLLQNKILDLELQVRNGLNPESIGSIIKEQIKKLEIGGSYLVDYASHAMGGRILQSKTSTTYMESSGFFKRLFRLDTRSKSANIILDPDNSPGNCWPTSGADGFVTIILGSPVIPTHFSIDHLGKEYKLDRTSAPKSVVVFGYQELGNEPIELVRYEYDLNGPKSQIFPATTILTAPVRFIKLQILSNHGKEGFTCLYRFRAHSDSSIAESPIFGDSQ